MPEKMPLPGVRAGPMDRSSNRLFSSMVGVISGWQKSAFGSEPKTSVPPGVL